MARKKQVKRAPRINIPTANTGALMGQGIQSASTAAMGNQLASAEMGAAAGPRSAATGAAAGPRSAATGARRKSVGTANRGAAAGLPPAAMGAAAGLPPAAMGAAAGPQSAAMGAAAGPQSAAMGAANISPSGQMTGRPSRMGTPFFEGANAFDIRVGYFRVPPGVSPQVTLAQLLGEGYDEDYQ